MRKSTLDLNHSLVICSRDRVESLLSTLRTILDQDDTKFPQEIVLVINLKEISQLDYARAEIGKLNHENLQIVLTTGGLPSARNMAKRLIRQAEVVHFIDDDVVVEREYFHKVEEFLLEYPVADGGAPIPIKSLNESTKSKFQAVGKVKSWLGLTPLSGRVSVSTRNYWGTTHYEKPFVVDWLPGFAMFYRFETIKSIDFEEDLEQNTLGGYGLGEDLIFTLELSSKGYRLFGVPSVCVLHNEDPRSARESKDIRYASGELRAELFRRFPRRFSKWKYILSILFEAIAISKVFPSQTKNIVSASVSEISGFLKGKPLNQK